MKKLAEKWNQSTKRIPTNKSYSNYAVDKEKLFPRKSMICDLGGGIGSDALYFIKKGHQVILIDISDYALRVAERKARKSDVSDRLSTIQVDLSNGKIPLDDESVDILYSRLTLHCFDIKLTAKLFHEVYRVLKQGGRAFITIKSPKDKKVMKFLLQSAKKIKDGLFLDKGQLKGRFSKVQLENMLKIAGIDKVEINEYKENVSGKFDKVRSGSKELLLNEILIYK